MRVLALLLPGIAFSISAQPSPPRTIKYPAVSSASALALTTPSLTLSQDKCELNNANAVVIQRNGGVVVSNAGNRQFCFYDARGSFIAAAGRSGAGPGEFEEIYFPGLYRGDSIIAADRRQNRLTVFGPRGERGREFLVTKPDSLGSQTAAIPLESGEFLLGFSEITRTDPRPEAVIFHQQLVRVSPVGVGTARVARLAASEHFVQKTVPEMGGVAYWSLQFGRILSVSPTPTGFVSGDGTDDILREYDAAGQVRTLHVTGLVRRPVTPEMIKEFREQTLRSTRPERRAITEKMLEEMPYPKLVPAYMKIVADPSGPVWVRTYPDRGDSFWIRLDPAAASARAYRFPPRFTLHAVRGDRACGIGRDADDLQTVYCFAVSSR